jgi:YHS domain-containing protein
MGMGSVSSLNFHTVHIRKMIGRVNMEEVVSKCVYPFDPVCGEVLTGEEGETTTRNGKSLYGFCSSACREIFSLNPDLFIFYRKKGGKRLRPMS